MNISGMIVADLKRKRATAMEKAAQPFDQLLALYEQTNGAASAKGRKAGRKPRSAAQKAALAKAQEARKGKVMGEGKGQAALLAAAAGG